MAKGLRDSGLSSEKQEELMKYIEENNLSEISALIQKGQYYGMDQLIKTMMAGKLPVTKYEMSEYWLDVGRIDDYEKAEEMYKVHMAK